MISHFSPTRPKHEKEQANSERLNAAAKSGEFFLSLKGANDDGGTPHHHLGSILQPGCFFPQTPAERSVAFSFAPTLQHAAPAKPRRTDELRAPEPDPSTLRKEKCVARKIRAFRPVIDLLEKVLLCQPLAPGQVHALSAFELQIVGRVLARKFGGRLTLDDPPTPGQLLARLDELRAAKSLKRMEENNKFVIKHTLKNLKQLLKEDQQVCVSNRQFEDAFARHYWPDAAPAPLAETLSVRAVARLFAGKAFARDFRRHISAPGFDDAPFVAAYVRTVRPKLEKLFARWEQGRSLCAFAPAARARMLEYFEHNKQCKLPWTLLEVVTALRSFATLADAFDK